MILSQLISSMSIFDRHFGSVIGVGDITLGQVCLCTMSAMFLGFIISLIYMFTHQKEGYSSSYVGTLILLPGIISIILIIIGDSEAAELGLLGAFSLVRFRSVPGDPKDLTYIFFGLAMGLTCGIGYVGYAIVFTFVLGLVIIIVDVTKFGTCKTTSMVLKVTVPENLNYDGLFDATLDKYTSSWNFHRVKTVDFGSLYEVVYYIELKNDSDRKKFMDEVRTLNGNLTVTLIVRQFSNKLYEQ